MPGERGAMDERIAGLTLAEAARLVEASLTAQYGFLQALPGAGLRDNGVLTHFWSPVPQPFFNAVVRAHLPAEVAGATIDVLVRQHHAAGTPLRWWVGPSTQPRDLGRLLVAHGATHAMDSPGMAVDLADLPETVPAPPGLAIVPVDSPARLWQYCAAFTAGFGVPARDGEQRHAAFAGLGLSPEQPLRHYVGVLDGAPVASASLFLGGGAAGLYHIAVAPGARRLGIGAAITVAALRDARAAGYRVGVLQAIPPAERVYARVGFRACCTLGVYHWT